MTTTTPRHLSGPPHTHHRHDQAVRRRALSRRSLLGLGAAVGAAATLSACGVGSRPPLSLYTWDDYDDPAVLKEFTERYRADVRSVLYDTTDAPLKALKKAKASGTMPYDLVVTDAAYIPEMISEGLLSPFDADHIPNLTNSVEQLDLIRQSTWDPTGDYTVCKAWGTTGFMYDTEVVGRELTSWKDFIETMQTVASGKTSVLPDPGELAGLYFWANGIRWDTQRKSDYARYEKWVREECSPHAKLDDTPAADGHIGEGYALIQVWNGDARQALINDRHKERWRWVLPSPESDLWMDVWCIPAGAPHPEAAHAFLNYILSTEVAFKEMDYTGYDTGVTGLQQLSAKRHIPYPNLIFPSAAQIGTMRPDVVGSQEAMRTAALQLMQR